MYCDFDTYVGTDGARESNNTLKRIFIQNPLFSVRPSVRRSVRPQLLLNAYQAHLAPCIRNCFVRELEVKEVVRVMRRKALLMLKAILANC